MNWDQHLSSILSETDESLAKMRERLTPHVRSHRRAEGASLLRDITTHPRPSPSLSPTTQWSDLTAIQSQLQQQTQTIESLTQSLRLMEREHTAQQRQIGTLQDEQRRLQERLADRTRDSSPGMDGRIERWKKEMDRELSSLRGRISRATAQEQHEESFSSKLHREELEQLRREVDLLSGKLMRQEEDTFQLQSEARETRRQYDRSSKALEKLSDSFLSHSLDLSRTVSQYHHTQQEVQNLRITVSELKTEVKGLVLKEVRPVSPNIPQNTAFVETAKATVRRRVSSGSEDDFSLTPTLGEISSDDLDACWLEEAGPQTRTRRRRRHHAQLKSELSGSDLTGSDDESTLGDHLNLVSEGMSRGSNSPPDLSLSDL